MYYMMSHAESFWMHFAACTITASVFKLNGASLIMKKKLGSHFYIWNQYIGIAHTPHEWGTWKQCESEIFLWAQTKRCYNLHTYKIMTRIIERPNLYMYLGVKKTEIVRQNRVY